MKKHIITSASIAVFVAFFALIGHVSTITAGMQYADINVKNLTLFTLNDVTISSDDNIYYYNETISSSDTVSADCIPAYVNFVTVSATVHNQYVQIPVYNVQYLINSQHELNIKFTVDDLGKITIDTNDAYYNY